MFTEGLDSKAVKWVQEENGVKTRDVPTPVPNLRLESDPFVNLRNGGPGFGLPSTAKFQSGYLPSRVVPVSQTITLSDDASGSGSDMDICTDLEDEVYSGHYSLASFPQHVPKIASPKCTDSVERQSYYVSDQSFSDFCSSEETNQHLQGHDVERFGRRGGGYPIEWPGYSKDEFLDSTVSSEASTQVKSKNGGLYHRGIYNPECYSSSGLMQAKTNMAAEQDFHGRLHGRKICDNDIPSTPPVIDSDPEINQVSVETYKFGEPGTPWIIESTDSGTTANRTRRIFPETFALNDTGSGIFYPSLRNAAGAEGDRSFSSSAHFSMFQASGQGPWCAVITYDACLRLCLHSWAKGCTEAPIFLQNECALLRSAFGLKQMLLQPEEELLEKQSSELVSEGSAQKPKKIIGKIKVQVRKVKMAVDQPTCSFSSLTSRIAKLDSLRLCFFNLKSAISSGWEAFQKVHTSHSVPKNVSLPRQCLLYFHASAAYIKQVSGHLKAGATTFRNSSSYERVQETYFCLLRLKSSSEEDAVRIQQGSGESHIFFPDNLGDELIVDIQDSNGKSCGRVQAQVAAIAENPREKLRWWDFYCELDHELVGRIQLYMDYSHSPDENSQNKWSYVAETAAYDLVLEVAMKAQHFRQRNLLLHDHWKWLVTEFASYYGVSDAYAKLRYLSYVMDVATPTADCLILVHDLLLPVLVKGNTNSALSHQENRILGEIEEKVQQTLAMVFENYKSLDESSLLGTIDFFRTETGLVAPVLAPAIKLYNLLHEIPTSEAQLKLCRYFQAAARKRSRCHLAETDEFASINNQSAIMDSLTLSTGYQKMKSLCLNIKMEIFTDKEIHSCNVLPSFLDLPNLSSSIYSAELCSRLRAFLVACPPTGPSPPVVELVVATADFQKDLTTWNINPVKGGVDAKELFHSYIIHWIQDKRLALLELCTSHEVNWSGLGTQLFTTPFVDVMYDRLKETLNEYEVVICRWPEYTFVLENAIADVEEEIIVALDWQYADVLYPLKDNLISKKIGIKFVQNFAKRTTCNYTIPDELGVLLNSMKRMLDVLRPRIETQLKSWGLCISDSGNIAPGERLSEITVMLRAKFRNYVQAVIGKLAENTKMQNSTKLKKIIQDSKETLAESDVRSRLQPLKELLTKMIVNLHTVLETHVFIAVCQGLWERMGQDVLSFLETTKENRTWYRGSRVAVSVLDDIFASNVQQLIGNALQDKDLNPPRSILEVRSILCRDSRPIRKENNYFY